jgi:hypothetical protein
VVTDLFFLSKRVIAFVCYEVGLKYFGLDRQVGSEVSKIWKGRWSSSSPYGSRLRYQLASELDKLHNIASQANGDKRLHGRRIGSGTQRAKREKIATGGKKCRIMAAREIFFLPQLGGFRTGRLGLP